MKIAQEAPIKVTWGALIFFGALAVAIGGWMTSMELRAQDHAEKLSVLQSIDKRLYRIEIMLEGKQ